MFRLNIIYRYPNTRGMTRAQALNEANSAPDYLAYRRAMRCLERGQVPSHGEELHAELTGLGRFEEGPDDAA